MEGLFAHGLFEGEGLEGRATFFPEILRGLVRGFSPAASAYGSVGQGIGFLTKGTKPDLPLSLGLETIHRNPNGVDFVRVVPGASDFGKEPLAVLFGLGPGFEKPCSDVGPGIQAGCVQGYPNALARVFVVETEGITSEVEDFQPPVSGGAGGEELDGVGQAFGGFGNRVEKDPPGKALQGQVHHETAEKDAGRGIIVKRFNKAQVFLVRVGSDIHDDRFLSRNEKGQEPEFRIFSRLDSPLPVR